jgi:hypothetical protein
LYNGIKETVSSNFNTRLYLDGNDELTEISLVFNEMADKLNINKQKMSVTLQDDLRKHITSNDIEELKKMLFQIKVIEEQTATILSRLEKK